MKNELKFLPSSEVNVVSERFSQIFNLDKGLPEQVFKRRYEYFYAGEFEWVISPEFWRAITNETPFLKDPIFIASLENHLGTQLSTDTNYRIMDALQLTPEMSGDEYVSAFLVGENDSPTPALMYQSTNAWLPESGDWAIWGQREYEMCVLGCSMKLKIDPSETPATWVPMSVFLDELSYRPEGKNGSWDQASKMLLQNYGLEANKDME